MTEVQAAKLLTMLITAFPDGMRFLDDHQQQQTRALYRQFLLDLPFDAGDAGIRRLIATGRKWPLIADLRGAIQLYVTGRPAAGGEAWGALRALRSGKSEEQYLELDPILRQCLVSFDWIVWDDVHSAGEVRKRWRVVTGENEAADRARFIELYDQLSARQATDAVAGQLAPPVPRRRLGGGETMSTLLGHVMPKHLPAAPPRDDEDPDGG